MPLALPATAPSQARPLAVGGTLLRRFLILVAAVALPLTLLLAWALEGKYANSRASNEHHLLHSARIIADAVDGEFERGAAALAALAASAALQRNDLDAFEDEMRAVALAMHVDIGLATPDGVQAVTTLWQPRERRPGVPAPAIAMQSLAARGARISDVYARSLDGMPVVTLSSPVFAPDRTRGGPPDVAYILGFIVPGERLGQLVDRIIADGDHGTAPKAAILDQSGRFVSRIGTGAPAIGEAASPELVGVFGVAGTGIVRDRISSDGTPVVTAFRRAPGSGFGVVVSVPRDAFYGPVRDTALRGVSAAVAVLAACLGLATVASRHLAATFRRIPREVFARAGLARPAATWNTGLLEADQLSAALAGAVAGRDRATAEIKALFALSPVGMVRMTLDGRILEANDAYRRMHGLSDAQASADGMSCTGQVMPEALALPPAVVAEVRCLGSCASFEMDLAFSDGRRLPVLVAFVLLDRLRGEGAAFVVDLTRQKQVQQLLTESEARLARALSAAHMATWEWDCETDALTCSAGLAALFHAEPGSLGTREAVLSHVLPVDREQLRTGTDRFRLSGGGGIDQHFRVQAADGSLRWLRTIGQVTTRNPDGSVRESGGVVMDVTPLREEQGRREMLIREVDHRAKNVLAVVQAVVKLTVAEDPKQFTKVVQGRIAALAHAHTLLSRDNWAGAGIRAVLDEELAPFREARYGVGSHARVTLEGPRVVLSPWAVQPFAMALHELVTNAVRFGALAHDGGSLAVTWAIDPGSGDLRVLWQEDRPGAPSGAPARRGFGTRLIDNTLRDQLRGEITRDWTPAGLHCALHIPAAQLTGAGAVRSQAARPTARQVPGSRPALFGCRVLVVEDETVLAQALVASLAALGVEVVGPAATLEEGLRLAALAPDLDAAVLDVHLGGKFSYPIADVLAGRGVPTVFATGYGSLPDDGTIHRHAAVPLLHKPLRQSDLTEALQGVAASVTAATRLPAPMGSA